MKRVFFFACILVLICSSNLVCADSADYNIIIPSEYNVQLKPMESKTIEVDIRTPSFLMNVSVSCEIYDSTICDVDWYTENQGYQLKITGLKAGTTNLSLFLCKDDVEIENTETVVTVEVIGSDNEHITNQGVVPLHKGENNPLLQTSTPKPISTPKPVILDDIVLADYSSDDLIKFRDRIQAYLENVAPDKAAVNYSTASESTSDYAPNLVYVSGNAEQIPAGISINRYGEINKKVNFRSGPEVDAPLAGDPFNSGSFVYMIINEVNNKGEVWTKIIAREQEGYVKSEYITVLSDSDNERIGKSYSYSAQINAETSNTSDASAKTQSSTKKQDARGKTFSNSKGVTLKVLDVQQTKGDDYFEAEEGNVFVLIELEIENKSSVDVYINSTFGGFDAICDDYMVGISYMAELIAKSRLSSTELKPGKKVKGWKGIEVPKNWKEIIFTFTPMKPTGSYSDVGEPIDVYIYNK